MPAARALVTVSLTVYVLGRPRPLNSYITEVKETATPQSQKGLLDKASESASSALDKGVGAVQPGTSSSHSSRHRTD